MNKRTGPLDRPVFCGLSCDYWMRKLRAKRMRNIAPAMMKTRCKSFKT